MPNYDSETCEGCVHHEGETCGHPNNWIDRLNLSGEPLRPLVTDDSESCEHFTPDLQCRQVRALEAIAEKTSGLEMNTRHRK